MIRGLLLLVLFAAGLVAAALSQGRMHHLRLAVPDRLPGWTDAVAPDAGLRRGAMTLPARGRWPETTLAWTARLPTADGWNWDVVMTGEGIDLSGQVTLSYTGDRALLSGGTGSPDLGALVQAPVPVQGIARVDVLGGTVTRLRADQLATGTLDARLPALRIDGADLGSGPLSGALAADGAWHLDLRLDGGATGVDAKLAGALGLPAAQLDAAIADGTALPPRLRALLGAVAAPEGPGWRLSAAVPVP